MRNWRPAIAALTLLLSACKGTGGFSSPGLPEADAASSHGKIQHIVIIVQENRSFNNLFYGYPGAKTASYGYNSTGAKVALAPVSLATSWQLQHNANGYLLSCNGTGKIPGTGCRMNGFNKEKWTCTPSGQSKCPIKYPPYAYVPHNQTKPYFDMARQYVLADQMYASDFDISSFISHQYIIAGTNPESTYDYPDQDWGCPGVKGDGIKVLGPNRALTDRTVFPCWNVTTLGDELDKASLPWAFYAVTLAGSGKLCGTGTQPDGSGSRGRGIWSAYQTIKHICYGSDWNQDVKTPPTQFLSDVSNGNLSAVSWVTPTFGDSDHPGNDSTTGPSWIASLVNAVGESQYWESTAIFIFWDDPGGWFDPEPPDYVANGGDGDGLGYRLPLLIVSPYAKKGHVSHVHYEHGSILKFVEDQFGLARLADSDHRATSPASDCFDFSQSPRKFVPIKAPYDKSYFMRQPADTRPPDTD